jgi:serine/threonine-protein kinase
LAPEELLAASAERSERVVEVISLLEQMGIGGGPTLDDFAGDDGAFDPRLVDLAGSGLSLSDVAEGQDEGPGIGRFRILGELGVGGMAKVYQARDAELRRRVALKVLAPDRPVTRQRISRFVAEAQITAQLQHPNIVPVHDIGITADGYLYFVMKRVEGRSLQQVIHALRGGDQRTAQHWSRHRLLAAFVQVCQAVAYAHSRGILHRDLKPENIMLGAFGEVMVMDWGVARVMGDRRELRATFPEGAEVLPTATADGSLIGTPGYISPEQARGDLHLLDGRSDQWSLGAILYELLTFEPAYTGVDIPELLLRSVNDEPMEPRRRAPKLQIPPSIAEVCMRAMRHQPSERFTSVLDLAEAVAGFLEGRRRSEEAADRLTEAQQQWRLLEVLNRERAHMQEREQRLASSTPAWASLEDKAALLQVRQRLRALEPERVAAFSRVFAACERALSHDPDDADARSLLASAYWSRLEEAEENRDLSRAVYYETRVREYDDGSFAVLLEGTGALTLLTDPQVAQVVCQRVEPRRMQWAMEAPKGLGSTPVLGRAMAPGSYVLSLRAPGCATTVYPVRIARGRHWHSGANRLRLLSLNQLEEDFRYVPGGPFQAGGDRDAAGSHPRSEPEVPGFFIGRTSVTVGAYLEFINDLHRRDPETAWRRSPRHIDSLEAEDGEGRYWSRPEAGEVYRLPAAPLRGADWDPQWPVFGVSWHDAMAYVAWFSMRRGRTYDLPGDLEWEKAARGVDGRAYPWGGRFDPVLCKMRDSREGTPVPEPVGRFDTDRSVYGVRDLAGCVANWCRDDHFDGDSGRRVVRGGSWLLPAQNCRSAYRQGFAPGYVDPALGFRLVRRASE